jgi:alkylation response protein AidB-like acyl-CoA dehydrogenase/putative sterol carrier protein
MNNYYFTEDHEVFRQSVRQFFQKEVIPFIPEWEKAGEIPKGFWKKMGAMGFLGLNYPEKYGGSNADFFYTVVLLEEIARVNSGGFGAAAGVTPYMAGAHILAEGSDYLKDKYLPGGISGDLVGALAITEPNAGSDVANIRTKAELIGNEYLINGSKTFITNGVLSDYIIVACKTNPSAVAGGISLIIVDRDTPGVSARKLNKLGWHCSDTGEISLDNVRVPAENLLGQENRGFYYIMEKFQLERLIMGIGGVAAASFALETALNYMNERSAFSKKLTQFQVLRHRVVDLAAEIEAYRQFGYYVSRMHNDGKYAVKEASMLKLLGTELSDKAMTQCLQFFGGYGFMEDYPLARAYRDTRIGTIGGGSSEIMREIISKLIIDGLKYQNNDNQVITNNFTARQIIQSLSKRLKTKKAEAVKGVYHFDIQGSNGGKFTVIIDNGVCKVQEGLSGEANCVVETTDAIYEAVELGKMNPQEAFMSGQIKASNPMEMLVFGGLFERMN